MDNQSLLQTVVGLFAFIAAICGVVVVVSRRPLTCALGLLGVLLCTAGIYGMIGEHFVATIQLVVYAGAIMVLFIFSIMLFNFKPETRPFQGHLLKVIFGLVITGSILGFLVLVLTKYFEQSVPAEMFGRFNRDAINQMGGNSQVLAHALFTHHYISFEAISLALLIALVGAVVLAKRKFD